MAIINRGPGNDRITGTNQADTIHGGGGNDVINARAGNDNVFGDAGNDSIGGGGGNDFMDGGTGNDFVQGGAGNDVLFGGVNGGTDRLAGDAPAGGGTGIDEFQFNTVESGNDRIFDFGNPRAAGDPQTGDHIVLLDTTTQDILDVYGAEINTQDAGVSNVNGVLVINFGQAPNDPAGDPGLVGDGVLTLDNFGLGSLNVGTDIIGNDGPL